MAKIIFHKKILTDEIEELDLEGSYKDILFALDIPRETLQITINGETPTYIDLESNPEPTDVVEIRRIVLGGAKDKQGLAAVIQIAALVVITVLSQGATSPWLIAAIAAGSAVVSGALNARAMKMLSRSSSGASVQEMDIASNSYSLTNINNDPRPNQTIPLIFGSHKSVPDILSLPYRYVYKAENVFDYTVPWQYKYYPAITPENGPLATDNSWITMPAGFIKPGFPAYEIKFAPYPFGIAQGELTPAIVTSILNEIKNHYNDWYTTPSSGMINFYNGYVGTREAIPLVFYHSSPSDPYYGRYNLFFLLARWFDTGLTYYSPTSSVYDFRVFWIGTAAPDLSSFTAAIYRTVFGGTTQSYLVTWNFGPAYIYPPRLSFSINNDTDRNNALNHWRDFLLELNGGSLSSDKNFSYLSENLYQNYALSTVRSEGIDVNTQLFCHGIGDFELTERRIGVSDIVNSPLNMNASFFSPIRKTDWIIPSALNLIFQNSLVNYPDKKLSNIDSPTTPIDFDDEDQHNWIHLESKRGYSNLYFYFSGRLYSTNQTTGFSSNICDVEIQVKQEGDTTWRAFSTGDNVPMLRLVNNNTKLINAPLYIDFAALFVYDPTKIYKARIRKVTLDSVNNNENQVCDLSLSKISFDDHLYYSKNPNVLAPLNVDGVYWTALINDTGSNPKFSAMAVAKCWVFDFADDEWKWQETRNPAWWWLYYCMGGYLRTALPELESFPYNPTPGFTTAIENPNKLEHLFGIGVSYERIDIDRIKSWAQFCDDNDLKIDMVLKDDTSAADVLERIANVGRGSVTYYSGIHSVVYEDPNQIPQGMFTMADIIAGSFSVNYSVGNPIRKVTASFINRETWETEKVEAFVPYSDPENLQNIDMTLEGVTEKQQAQREVNILAARQFYQRRTYSWDVDVNGVLAKRGSLYYLSHDSTQYGWSGSINEFIFDAEIKGIRTSAILDDSISHVTIRCPDNTMQTYACHIEGNNIIFDDLYPIELAPFYVNTKDENALSSWDKSFAEDFVFIAGALETSGKLVRISNIVPKGDFQFTITAVDEDPAMWAYEYDDVIPPESFSDSNIVLEPKNVSYEILTEGLVKIFWDNVDYVEIVSEETGLPIEANGSYAFSGGVVTLELVKGRKYTLLIKPFAIGTPFKSVNKKVVVWP